MGFTAKNSDLLGEQYRNIDEQIRLGSAERALSIQLEALRRRRRELRLRNEEICFQLRPDSDANVSYVDFTARIRLGKAA
jgi:hypothetical protein